MLTPSGHYCQPGDDILTESECRTAAKSLGLVFARAWSGAGDHKLCVFADDNREKVYFNDAPSVSPYGQPNYKSVCHRVTPWVKVERCTHHTAEGLKEIKVSDAGYWAIAVLAGSGVWIAALWFVLIMVGLCKSARVHPMPSGRHAVMRGVSHSEDVLALENMTAEEIEDKQAMEELRQEKKCRKRCKKKCKHNCRRCWRTLHHFKQIKKVAKKLCKLLMKTQASMVGTAAFVATAILLVILGGTQMPKERPFCARKPRMPIYPAAWAQEPAQRYAVVWCEYGSMASVGLGFVAFCCFLLAFSMSFVKVKTQYNADRTKKLKLRLKNQREHAVETGEVVESEGVDYGPGFRIQKMIPKESEPKAVYEDYDGRIFDC